jgi:cardiolipin synthase
MRDNEKDGNKNNRKGELTSMDTEKSRTGDSLRHQALSIPNILGYFRILLIPVFIYLHARAEYVTAGCALLISALTDVLDGRIARKFGMVTELGKVVDPVADKLTQAAMIVCVAQKVGEMKILFVALVVKELLMLGMAALSTGKRTPSSAPNGSAKRLRPSLYVVMIAYVLIPDMPERLTIPPPRCA